ncbi:MAG: MerR family transcriptional regulator [Lachnospiraceae bacterium]
MNNNKRLFTIGEIAKSLGITRRIILNYEEHDLIKPDMKNGDTGNRLYTIDTFTQIRTIRTFQNLGLSLDEIRGYLDNSMDVTVIIHRLEKMRDELNLNIEKLYERQKTSTIEIKEIQLSPQTIYRRRIRSSSIEEKTNLLRDTALDAFRIYGTDTSKRLYFTEFPLSDPEEISYCVAVLPNSQGEFIEHLPAIKAVSFFHHGAYEEIPAHYPKLLTYAKEHGLKPQGIFRHVYLEGPPQHQDKSRFITQIILPLESD